MLPQRLFIQITEECNLRCMFCSYWKRKDSTNKLWFNYKLLFVKNVIYWLESQNKDFRKSFRVILTGGEPFFNPDQVFSIAKICKNNNVACDVNTNGSLLGINVDLVELITSGLKVTISIDSHKDYVHDNIRGRLGLFNHVIDVINRINSMKNVVKKPITLWVQSVLGDWNYKFIYEHIKFFKNLNVNGFLFQPLQYNFGVAPPKLWYKNFYGFPNYDKDLLVALETLLDLKRKDDFVINSEQEIKSWKYYFENPERLVNQTNICKAPEQNIIVDVEGNISFCGWYEPTPKDKIGNIANTSIEEIWNGDIALREKNKLKYCNKGCATAMCNVEWE
ncbi:hypothetical protein LCGC14_0900540 [marine sediment metagenome]|uniref:Radical SAM core domain-containing protein n=1 Tax=marine sediment metagenome TaxID=412755 RepID=A0A0F9PHC1_9ZZZZ